MPVFKGGVATAEMIVKAVVRPIYKKFEYCFNRTILKRNLKLRNKYVGRRIIILGDGLSLGAIDLKKLKNEFTFGCNYVMLHNDFLGMDLNFYSMIASRRSANAVPWSPTGSVQDGLIRFNKMIRANGLKCFFDVSMRRFVEENALFQNDDVHYVMSGEGLQKIMVVNTDLSKPVSTMEGSLYFMIASSIYMGFKEIYICGSGYTYFPQQVGHFYDGIFELNMDPPDSRHFLMKQFAEDNGVEIINVVPDGYKSPVYQSISVQDLYDLAKSA